MAQKKTIQTPHDYVKLSPPAELSIEAMEVWHMIVNNCSPEHFKRSDEPLLATYCEVTIQRDRAYKEMIESDLTIEGASGSMIKNPIVTVHTNFVSALSNLAMRLRLSPSTRIATKTPVLEAPQPEVAGENKEAGIFAH